MAKSRGPMSDSMASENPRDAVAKMILETETYTVSVGPPSPLQNLCIHLFIIFRILTAISFAITSIIT